MAICKPGQSGEVILQIAQVQMLPIVSRIVRRFYAGRSHNTEKETDITQLAMMQVNQPLRKRDSKISHQLGFLIQKKKEEKMT